ncbi:MAG: DUF2267 domain-containing protein, partial [Anaerolineae bacterium]
YFEDAKPKPEVFSAQEFLKRAAAREDVDLPVSSYHGRVVIEVLSEALTPAELTQVRDQLPADYDPLFEAGSQGKMDLG